jgi:SAM-dependent methyltransferase
MTEFWEASFTDKQEMWGMEPAHSAIAARDIFVAQQAKNILVPGIGYGRNAQLFRESGMEVTGIEISATAIELAHKHYGKGMAIYHGSVTDMPFDAVQYDGVFCHAVIHLLDAAERKKLIHDCYNQLASGGQMVFSVISKAAPTYGQGQYLSEDRYEMFGGVQIYFYDRASITAAFGEAGLQEVTEITENYPFYLVRCQKA